MHNPYATRCSQNLCVRPQLSNSEAEKRGHTQRKEHRQEYVAVLREQTGTVYRAWQETRRVIDDTTFDDALGAIANFEQSLVTLARNDGVAGLLQAGTGPGQTFAEVISAFEGVDAYLGASDLGAGLETEGEPMTCE